MGDSDVTPVMHIIDVARQECDRKQRQCRDRVEGALAKFEERLDKKHDLLLVLVGPDGKNGKFGGLTARVAKLEDVEDARTKRTVSLATKIIAGSLVAVTSAGGGTYMLVRALLGGG